MTGVVSELNRNGTGRDTWRSSVGDMRSPQNSLECVGTGWNTSEMAGVASDLNRNGTGHDSAPPLGAEPQRQQRVPYQKLEVQVLLRRRVQLKAGGVRSRVETCMSG